jgi:hypothetical protein
MFNQNLISAPHRTAVRLVLGKKTRPGGCRRPAKGKTSPRIRGCISTSRVGVGLSQAQTLGEAAEKNSEQIKLLQV